MSNLGLVRKVLDAFAAGDLPTLMTHLADDVVFEFPYSHEGAALDRAAAHDLIGFVIRTFDDRTIALDRVYEPTNSDGLIIEYSSHFHATAGDVNYENRYVAFFEFRDGLISRWREYANPLPFEAAMKALRRSLPRP